MPRRNRNAGARLRERLRHTPPDLHEPRSRDYELAARELVERGMASPAVLEDVFGTPRAHRQGRR